MFRRPHSCRWHCSLGRECVTEGTGVLREASCPTGFLILPSDPRTTVSCLDDCTSLSREGSLHPCEPLRYSKWHERGAESAPTRSRNSTRRLDVRLLPPDVPDDRQPLLRGIAKTYRRSSPATPRRTSTVYRGGDNPRRATGFSHCYPTIPERVHQKEEERRDRYGLSAGNVYGTGVS